MLFRAFAQYKACTSIELFIVLQLLIGYSSHKTSLIPSLFIEVSEARNVNGQIFMCLCIYFVPFFEFSIWFSISTTCYDYIATTCHDYLTTTCRDYITTTCYDYLTTTCHDYLTTTCRDYITTTCYDYLTTTCHDYLTTTCHDYITTTCHDYITTTCSDYLTTTCYDYLTTTCHDYLTTTCHDYLTTTCHYYLKQLVMITLIIYFKANYITFSVTRASNRDHSPLLPFGDATVP